MRRLRPYPPTAFAIAAVNAPFLAIGVHETAAAQRARSRPPLGFNGKLPFELPPSMNVVEAQRSDVPSDSARPLFPFRFGRAY
jgi:hypothetical protein